MTIRALLGYVSIQGPHWWFTNHHQAGLGYCSAQLGDMLWRKELLFPHHFFGNIYAMKVWTFTYGRLWQNERRQKPDISRPGPLSTTIFGTYLVINEHRHCYYSKYRIREVWFHKLRFACTTNCVNLIPNNIGAVDKYVKIDFICTANHINVVLTNSITFYFHI